MDFLAHIARDERIAALHISENAVSAAGFVRPSTLLASARIARIALPEGTIVNGRVANLAALTNALRRLGTKASGTRHVVVAMPHAAIFTKAVDLPGKVAESHDAERIAEAARHACEQTTPFEKETGYADTDVFDDGKVLVSAIAHDDAEPYFEALHAAGFRPVALESENAALARTLATNGSVITALPRATYTDIVTFRGNTLIHAASYPTDTFPTRQSLTREMKRVSELVAETFEKKPVTRTNEKLPFADDVRAILDARNDITFAPLLGALLRARIPRREDTAASLMPIGTEVAYEYQKLDAFVGLIGSVMIGAAIVLCLVSAGMWLFMTHLRASLPETTILSNTDTLDAATLSQREAYTRFTEVVHVAAELVTEETSYAEIIAFIRRHSGDGIVIREFIAGSTQLPITITGVARSYVDLNTLHDSLASAPEVDSISLHITDPEKPNAAVPFMMNLTLREPAAWRTCRVMKTP